MGDTFPAAGSGIIGETNIILLINKGLAYAILVALILSIFFVFWGGISFILSNGKEERVNSALKTIQFAIIGLIVTIFATTFIAIVGRALGYDLISQITDIRMIMEDVQSIIQSFQPGTTGSEVGGAGGTL